MSQVTLMPLDGTQPMAGRGRPKKAEDKQTATIRVRKDLAGMLAWIARLLDQDAADVIDPIIRDAIAGQYARFYPAILAIKVAEDNAAELVGKPPGDPLPPLPGSAAPAAPSEPEKPKRKKS